MGITKNKQTDEKLNEIIKLAFQNKNLSKVEELTEGMCNVAYMVYFDDETKSVLKIAASKNDGYMRNENNLMKTEVEAMNIALKNEVNGVAKVYFYDNSCDICDGKYFFMEVLDGENYIGIKDNMSAEENNTISKEIGVFQKSLTKIKNEYFGIVAHNEKFDSLFEFVHKLFSNVIADAKDIKAKIDIDIDEILIKLNDDKNIFDEVKTATLVHWDMWEGNVFIKDKKLNGIIDWERAMWCDPLIDDRFRSHNVNEYFLAGFGIKDLTQSEQRRVYWYDLFLYMTMTVEVFYREYEDDGQYNWVKPMLEDAWNKLNLQFVK